MPEVEESQFITRRELQNLIFSIVIAIFVVPFVYSLSFLVRKYFAIVLMTTQISALGPLWLLIPLTLGGIVAGIIVWNFAPEAQGPGLHIVIAAFHKRNGLLRHRTGFSKYVATLITVGSGTPSGIVSPSAVLGNSVASSLGSLVRIDSDQQKTLSLCGIAAAVSTLLGTPLGAALFAVEVVCGNYILYKRFFYCLFSSVTAYTLAYFLKIPTIYFGHVPQYATTPEILFLVGVTAVSAVCVNIGYIFLYQKIHDFFLNRSWKNKNWMKPVFGMVLAAVFMAPFYDILIDFKVVGGGYTFQTFTGQPLHQVLIVVTMIILATSLISGTGGSGGLFMPVMAVGGLLGILIGSFSSSPPFIFVAAGMSAALCTTLNVPLASAVLCIELFGPPAILPSVIGSLTGHLLARRYTIYHEIRWEELREENSDPEDRNT